MIGIDWGSSGFRAYRLADDGAICERRIATSGIASLAATDYAAVLQQQIGDWLRDAPAAPVLLSGMVGSRQGWREAPYVQCPAGLDDLAAGLCPVELGGGRIAHIVPGLCCRNADGTPLFPLTMNTQLFVSTALLATLTGLAAAVAPALRGARLDPVEAIRG